jgi:hypothetical protein
VGIPLLLVSISFGQETVSTSREADQRVAIVAEVIVTGSNIPTAEEVGPNNSTCAACWVRKPSCSLTESVSPLVH